jgi:DNA-directed RNA polymerase subunit K/omega
MDDQLSSHDDSGGAPATVELAPPITSRFLFVDVAAMRVNQLRRGARVRLQAGEGRHLPHRLERAAMDEVKQRLIQYSVPETPNAR